EAFVATIGGFVVVTALAAYAVLIRNFRAVDECDERRRIRWVVYGTAASILPYVFVQALSLGAFLFGRADATAGTAFGILSQATTAGFVFVPVTFGYAILKHKVFDIRVAIRLGVQRLFARGVLETLLALPIVGLVWSIASDPDL